MLDVEHNTELRATLSARLQAFDVHGAQDINQDTDQGTNQDTELTPAAVVIGICRNADLNTASILLTQRSSKLRQHASQFALPGGKVDAGETIQQAALRELQEELGLTQSIEDIIGNLDDMPTQSGFNITPVVVWISSLATLKPNRDEVARVYQIPLAELAEITLTIDQDDETDPTQITQPQGQTTEQSSSNQVMSLYIPSVGTTVYSPTAAIIYQFREVALLGKSTRVAHFGQPRFAWR